MPQGDPRETRKGLSFKKGEGISQKEFKKAKLFFKKHFLTQRCAFNLNSFSNKYFATK